MNEYTSQGFIDLAMPDMSVRMLREVLPVPDCRLPEGYRMEFYKDGDETKWADIEVAVRQFSVHEEAVACFRREFPETELRAHRILFAYASDGSCAGTAAAWFNPDGQGRVHWVAVHPEHRGKGVAKALVCRVTELLAELNPGPIVLYSGTRSHAAIGMYEKLGFYRDPAETGGTDEAWRRIHEANEQR